MAYLPLPIAAKIGISLAGLLLPWLLAFRSIRPVGPASSGFYRKGEMEPAPAWLWLSLGMLAAFLRLYGLTSLSVWPLWDEGYLASFAIDLAEKWRWHFLFGPEQAPPLFTWLQGLFFRIFEPSLFSMWLYPAIFSILAVVLGGWAGFIYFSRPFAFLYFLLLAFSFWPQYACRFSIPVALHLCWQYAALILLGLWISSANRAKGETWMLPAAFGFFLGAGFFVSGIWVSVAPAMVLAVFYLLVLKPVRDWKKMVPFLLSAAVPFAAFIFCLLEGPYGGHIQNYLAFTHRAPSWLHQCVVSLSYLTSLFWGDWEAGFHFGPLWGGLLDPLLASAFFLGLLEMGRAGQTRVLSWGALASILFLLPGVVSNTVEIMRIVPILPLILVVVAAGIQALLSSIAKPARVWTLGILLMISSGLDLYHILGPYHAWANPGLHSEGIKSTERFRAYQILQKASWEKGPGMVFGDFGVDVFDQSLLVSTYPFNAVRNPRIAPRQALWAAVLVPEVYLPYFSSHFSGAKVTSLSEGLIIMTRVSS